MIAHTPDLQFNIVEIFQSLQGEGYNTGMPAIFIRFGKCNLACPWCDTDYQTYTAYSLSQILQQVSQLDAKNIIITGGEPSVVPNLELLLKALKQRGYFLTMETNGLQAVPEQIDFISVSPKARYADKYQHSPLIEADEVRIVVDGEIQTFCDFIAQKITAKHYFLSPCEQHQQFNLQETLTTLGQLNQRSDATVHWQLSLQTHKLVGIR